MTYPSFASGDVLLTSDMNAVGLWLIKTQTIGSAVSSVTVSDAFSTTYDNYLITVAGGTHSTGGQVLNLKFGATTTGYYYNLVYTTYNTIVLAAAGANVGAIDYMGECDAAGLRANIQVMSPFLSKPTGVAASIRNGTSYAGTTNAFVNNSTSYTSFILGASAGTMTGGTIRVYGYRN